MNPLLRYIWILLAGGLAVWLVYRYSGHAGVSKPMASAQRLDSARIDALVGKADDEVLGQANPEAANDSPKIGNSSSNNKIQKARSTFVKLHQLMGSIHKDRLRGQLLERMAEDPEFVRMAQDILLKPGFARKNFGNDQAVARIYSIKLLSKLAQRGDFAPLVKAGAALAEQLDDPKAREHGRSEDLSNMLVSYMRLQGKEWVSANPVKLLKLFRYQPGLAPVFADALTQVYFDANRKVPEADIFNPLLNKSFRDSRS